MAVGSSVPSARTAASARAAAPWDSHAPKNAPTNVEPVAYQKLDQRLAALFVAKPGREINATHQALADELGSVRKIVSRLLRTFEDRLWVELGRERITIVDRDAIAALARS